MEQGRNTQKQLNKEDIAIYLKKYSEWWEQSWYKIVEKNEEMDWEVTRKLEV